MKINPSGILMTGIPVTGIPVTGIPVTGILMIRDESHYSYSVKDLLSHVPVLGYWVLNLDL
jgi:hypothetical protein